MKNFMVKQNYCIMSISLEEDVASFRGNREIISVSRNYMYT